MNQEFLIPRGTLAINDLLESPHLSYAAAQCCTLAELWTAEQVTVTTTTSNLVMVQTEDHELLALIRQHFRNAALDAQRTIFQTCTVPELRLRNLATEAQVAQWRALPLRQKGPRPLPDFLDER